MNNLAQFASLLSDLNQHEEAEAVYQKVLRQVETQLLRKEPQEQQQQQQQQKNVSWDFLDVQEASEEEKTTRFAHFYGNYANFIRKFPLKQEKAKQMYLKALQMDPANAHIQKNLYVWC